MMDAERKSETLLSLQQRLTRLVQVPATQGIWVTAELSDVAERGGHCYMELIEKDANGVAVAKARATIWRSSWSYIKARFVQQTGQQFATGLKLMVKVSATYHPLYGMNLVVNEVDPNYTMGDLQRRRQEILNRLKAEQVLNMNRETEFPRPTLRIAVISAAGAAGYGDFMNQLRTTGGAVRFTTRLFEAIMQGERAAASVIAALDRIAAEQECWDCVVIIRGGGASSDLSCFEDYDLANNVAQFPLPVIVGIGHERDVTVLDYIAKVRVKTPTAAAEYLVSMAAAELDTIRTYAHEIHRLALEMLAGSREQLAYYSAQLPAAPAAVLHRMDRRLNSSAMALAGISARRIAPLDSRLQRYAYALSTAATTQLSRRREQLQSSARLLAALSPEATLKRGYSITYVNGRAVSAANMPAPGDVVETRVASAQFTSTVDTVTPDNNNTNQ